MIHKLFKVWTDAVKNKSMNEKQKDSIKNQFESFFNGKVEKVYNDGAVDIVIKGELYRRMFLSELNIPLSNNHYDSCSIKFEYEYSIGETK
jgi:hypothetical protein